VQKFARVPSPGRIAEKTRLGEYHAPRVPRAVRISDVASLDRVGKSAANWLPPGGRIHKKGRITNGDFGACGSRRGAVSRAVKSARLRVDISRYQAYGVMIIRCPGCEGWW